MIGSKADLSDSILGERGTRANTTGRRERKNIFEDAISHWDESGSSSWEEVSYSIEEVNYSPEEEEEDSQSFEDNTQEGLNREEKEDRSEDDLKVTTERREVLTEELF